ncbi:hypothetical protein [Leptospira interrogans]|uniref:hypothetical protein n=1 Tax=Leptospira interrogans TaxID=173 RepID=UPI0002BBDEDB|nr:hypothetical protein [Leptospira interrogans]
METIIELRSRRNQKELKYLIYPNPGGNCSAIDENDDGSFDIILNHQVIDTVIETEVIDFERINIQVNEIR